ncbi:MAG: hypothetical protein QOE09_2533 [Ilumatobacteraceae bacterium]|jgi:hypothetical protein
MYEYKVLTERDKRFTGGFDPDTLEATLNSYASEGWRLVDTVSTGNLMKSAKAELIMILERITTNVWRSRAPTDLQPVGG